MVCKSRTLEATSEAIWGRPFSCAVAKRQVRLVVTRCFLGTESPPSVMLIQAYPRRLGDIVLPVVITYIKALVMIPFAVLRTDRNSDKWG